MQSFPLDHSLARVIKQEKFSTSGEKVMRRAVQPSSQMKRPKAILVKRIRLMSHTSDLAKYSPEDIWDYGQTSYFCRLLDTHFLLMLKQHPEYQHNLLL